MVKKPTLFRTTITYGLCAKVKLDSPKAKLLLNILEPILERCHMPDCKDEAVRVGIFQMITNATEFRGLCERHKQFGMWSVGW